MAGSTSIEHLRVYQVGCRLEDAVHSCITGLPKEEYFRLGNDMRRSSTAISHYIFECHRRYSYSMRLEAIHLAKSDAESLKNHLEEYACRGFGDTASLQNDCMTIIKQCWGLIRYLKQRQNRCRSAKPATNWLPLAGKRTVFPRLVNFCTGGLTSHMTIYCHKKPKSVYISLMVP